MKKIVEINTCDYGSTGRIMLQIADAVCKNGSECKIIVPEGRHNPWKYKKDYIRFGNRFSEDSHIVLGYFTGYQGCFSIFSTYRLIQRLKIYQPDVIHLHNLHKCYINLPILFNYIKSNNIRVIWTLHDCWSFTGQCPHFTMTHCEKWKTGCYECPSFHDYPESRVDRTKTMWNLKKKWFTGVQDLTIITPSEWLADLVKQSFLKDYPIKVINNGINLSIFKPTESDFRERHGITQDKFILLGVAFGWGKRKGLDVFQELAKCLDSEKYQIVLVGTDDSIDKQLPGNVISIHQTQNQTELAQIYTAADLLVNPTREDNYPTVNMEAIACGTPVLTFKTGGSPEILDESTGCVVACDDINSMEHEIIRISKDRPFISADCLNRARGFDMNERFMEYVKMILGDGL